MRTTLLLGVCSLFYVFAVGLDWRRSGAARRGVLELLTLVLLWIFGAIVVSARVGYVAFGSMSEMTVIAVMFVAIILGITARYIFYLHAAFSWLALIKPICISPILLLPLMGSLQGNDRLQPMQVASFALLAFQNGFFWQVVLEKARLVSTDNGTLPQTKT